MEAIKRLGNVVHIMARVDAELVKRSGKVAMYLRSDGYFEVFKIETAKRQMIFGREYGVRELYPHSDRFGNMAICTKFRDEAEKDYEEFNAVV